MGWGVGGGSLNDAFEGHHLSVDTLSEGDSVYIWSEGDIDIDGAEPSAALQVFAFTAAAAQTACGETKRRVFGFRARDVCTDGKHIRPQVRVPTKAKSL